MPSAGAHPYPCTGLQGAAELCQSHLPSMFPPTHPPTVSTSTIQTKAPVTPPHTFLWAREHPEGSPVNPPALSELLLAAAGGGDPTPNAGITEHTTPAT